MLQRAVYLAAVSSVLILVVACEDGVEDPVEVISEVFSGTLTQDAEIRHDFEVADAPEVNVTVISLGDPISDGSIAVGVGAPDGDACTISLLNQGATVGVTIQVTVGGPGVYCIRVTDNGSLPAGASASYQVQVDHF